MRIHYRAGSVLLTAHATKNGENADPSPSIQPFLSILGQRSG
jgi:hypothetical protein